MVSLGGSHISNLLFKVVQAVDISHLAWLFRWKPVAQINAATQ
eukprot:CAMPEP_0114657424 /NCGR_PEP_ID=MMETSP0191-20121206/13919_1 /TAXON_ID=126664 /ORGANISM="Sorites sp." /LENGTH=42 /DNA_ID= /DNA_START= /DNA_END= /DNA_ORIENTATION=